MPLPALTQFEIQMYLDLMTVYRLVKGTDNNPVGWAVVPVSLVDSTLLENVPCNWHGTPNYDEILANVAMAKQNNIFTANKFTAQLQVWVQTNDLVQVTYRTGGTDWQEVRGAPKKRILIPHLTFYTVPTRSDYTILTGPWTPTRTS